MTLIARFRRAGIFYAPAIAVALWLGVLRVAAADSRGATVPWIEYQAENGTLAGGAKVVGPEQDFGTFAGEAVGREAVLLNQTNHSVSWTATGAANSIVVRYCIPDATAGGGIDATISLYINGTHKADIPVTSRHCWLYGDYNTQTDNPANGKPRKLYDESRMLFNGFAIAAGDQVMLRKDAADAAAYYYIDFIDLEQVGPPLPMPAGYISITATGQSWSPAVPNDSSSFADNAISQCISAVGQRKYSGIYIPPGTFCQANKIIATNVKFQGAGMWYSTLYCPNQSEDPGWGATGFDINSDSCQFSDLAITGWGGDRNQGGKAFCNNAHKNTVLQRLWIEHSACGCWIGGSGESTNLLIQDCRIRNTGADGINLCNGCLNCTIRNCTARGTGDDAFAIWSAKDLYPHPCINNLIINCTAEVPWRAACFAIYGGDGNKIQNCVGNDALTYPGLTVSSEFTPYQMDSATVDGLTLNRCGSTYWDASQQFGSIWLYSVEAPFANVTIRNVDLFDPTYQGILIQSAKGTAEAGYPIQNTLLQNIRIYDPTIVGVQILPAALGGVTLANVCLASNTWNSPRLVNQSTSFTVNDQGASCPVSVNRPSIENQEERVVAWKNDHRIATFRLANPSHVQIRVLQANGRTVAKVLDRRYAAGKHSVDIGRNFGCNPRPARGVYLFEVAINEAKQVYPVFLR